MKDAGPPTTFRVLGPLEVRAGERRLPIGSGRQSTLLAALLMRAGHPVPVERLIADLWGEDPPASAGHAIEAYVSRLRGALSTLDVTIDKRGAGYRLDLADEMVDSALFEEMLTEAAKASAEGDLAEAGVRARAALSLWRGDAYADVLFGSGAPSEATRLDELRLVAHELAVDSALAAGENDRAIGELRGLVESAPYREGFQSRLMVGLYRSGRQAEALEIYEAYRRRLSDDLGLEPSPALQQLSGQIVRHERHLVAPSSSSEISSRRPPSAWGRRRLLLIAGVVGLIVIGAGVAASLDTSAAPKGPIRVGVVIPRKPTPGDVYVAPFLAGLERAKQEFHVRTRTIVSPENGSRLTPAQMGRLSSAIRAGRFDLVLVEGPGTSAQYLIKESSSFPHARFAIIDCGCGPAEFKKRTNVTGFRFADTEAGELAGYLAGLMVRATPGAAHRISAVGGIRFVPQVRQLVNGYVRGARLALPNIHVQVNYADSFTGNTCGRIADSQINNGSAVVFAPAGACGLSALSVADILGVWGIGADADRSGLNDHVLASTIARFDVGAEDAVRLYELGSLHGGETVLLDLNNQAVGITGLNLKVPQAIRKKVAALETQLQGHGLSPTTPTSNTH
jgi:DNA-binding SARP family transcriptional activator/basic membrane lipoprotein Med (substrate-binding protein (PBP1-ABC) superfamily)